MMSKIRTYFLIIILSIIFSLYFFESYLFFLSEKKDFNLDTKIKLYKNLSGNNYDTRTKSRIYKDLRTKNPNISVSTTPNKFNDPDKNLFFLSGVSNSETIDCNENGFFSVYKSDRYGFNNPDHEWDAKEIEYLLLGDSFVHGSCVNRPNDIASVLRSLSKKPTLNLGYRGNGPLIMYASLKEYLKPNTKKILWFYFEGNDLYDLRGEFKNQVLNKYYSSKNYSQNLINIQKKIDKLNFKMISKSIQLQDNIDYDLVKQSKFKNKLLKILRLDKTKKKLNLIFVPKKSQDLLFPKFKNILNFAKELAEDKGSEIYFVYLPQFERYKINFNLNNYKRIKSIVEELNIPMIDIHLEVFKNEKSPLNLFPFQMWGHYNVEGYEKVSKTIYRLTKDK